MMIQQLPFLLPVSTFVEGLRPFFWYLVPGTSAGTRYMVVNGYLVPGTGI